MAPTTAMVRNDLTPRQWRQFNPAFSGVFGRIRALSGVAGRSSEEEPAAFAGGEGAGEDGAAGDGGGGSGSSGGFRDEKYQPAQGPGGRRSASCFVESPCYNSAALQKKTVALYHFFMAWAHISRQGLHVPLLHRIDCSHDCIRGPRPRPTHGGLLSRHDRVSRTVRRWWPTLT